MMNSEQKPVRTESILKDLNDTYSPKVVESFQYRWLPTFAPNKRLPIHNWFYCTQAFSAELVQMLTKILHVSQFGKVLDPFCGIGTTLLACKQKGISSVGCDIFPLFCFVSKVKLQQNYDFQKLKEETNRLVKATYRDPSLDVPKHPIFTKAFSPQTLKEILFFKETILKVDDENTRDFLLLGLLSIVNEVGYIRKAGAHYRFINVDKIGVSHQYKKRKPTQTDVRQALSTKLHSMLTGLGSADVLSKLNMKETGIDFPNVSSEVFISDARRMPFLGDGLIDAVITSPPYLNRDSYVAQYKIELFLAEPPYGVTDFDTYRQITFSTLRSHVEARKPRNLDFNLRLKELDMLLRELNKTELSYRTIPDMVKGYFEDMALVFDELHRVLNADGKVALVVGNVRFGGVLIPVDFMLSRIAEDKGFQVNQILVTRYKLNSPQQMKKYGKVPVRESIIMLQK
jgi:DNA modification methylase